MNCYYCNAKVNELDGPFDLNGESACYECYINIPLEMAEFEVRSAIYRLMELQGLIDPDMRKPSAPSPRILF